MPVMPKLFFFLGRQDVSGRRRRRKRGRRKKKKKKSILGKNCVFGEDGKRGINHTYAPRWRRYSSSAFPG